MKNIICCKKKSESEKGQIDHYQAIISLHFPRYMPIQGGQKKPDSQCGPNLTKVSDTRRVTF